MNTINSISSFFPFGEPTVFRPQGEKIKRGFFTLCLLFPLWGLGGFAQTSPNPDPSPQGKGAKVLIDGENLGGLSVNVQPLPACTIAETARTGNLGRNADINALRGEVINPPAKTSFFYLPRNKQKSPAGDFAWANAPTAGINFNKLFGGSDDDYTNTYSVDRRDIKVASDGTIWICGSTASTDGDLAASGNRGGTDAWLLNIDPATSQIKYSRCFGGSGNDEFRSMVLMSDGTIWAVGSTDSTDGDLAGAVPKGRIDGWLVHINPLTNQILYNRCIGGQYNDYFYKMALGSNNIIWLCGETLSADQDNISADFSGGNTYTDAWLVGVDSTQNSSAPLKYVRCFGGARSDGFLDLQPMPDGTIWIGGATRSNDSIPGSSGFHGAAGVTDGWILHVDPAQSALAAQVLYSRCFGGSNGEWIYSIHVIDPNNVWFCGSSASTDGNLTGVTNHGGDDLWLACVNTATNALTYNRCLGGANNEASSMGTDMELASDGTIWVLTTSSSTDGDLATAGSHGSRDIWLFNIDPATNQFNYNKAWGGTGDETMPAFAFDPVYLWVAAGSTSSANGDVVSTNHGAFDAWIFSINYGTTGIESITNDELRIYPNPVKDYLRFTIDNLRFNKVEILDLSGKTIVNLKSSIVNQIDVSNLHSGVYFVKIQTDSGVVTRKFVKE